MTFVLRLLGSVLLGIVIFLVVLGCILLVVWIVNRVLQLFFGYLGYEIGDFFSWIASKWKLKRKRRRS